MLKRYATCLTAIMFVWAAASSQGSASISGATTIFSSVLQDATPGSSYEGKTVVAIDLPGVVERDQDHLLELLPQKVGSPLNRDQVSASIRALYGAGRFADIQAEVTPSGNGVVLAFVTTPNYFVGAVDVEGAPNRPNANQIVNASKFQLGERYSQDKLDRALENIRQLMQENGYYKARVTAESTSNPTNQQVDILFHIEAGPQAHIGEVKVTGTSSRSSAEVQKIAHMNSGDRVTAARVTDSLQRLRRKFQKQNRALAQVSIAAQTYRPEKNALDFTFQIDPGPVVLISARGYHVSRGVLKREIPVYEENAVDDDLLNEGKRNLLDYLQTRGHFDAEVEIKKENDANTLRIIYEIKAGPSHKLALIDISGNKNFLDTAKLRSYLQIQPASRFLSHGRYSEALLKSDVATLVGLYKNSGFRAVKIDTKVDDNYQGTPNKLAVHIHIEEGPRTTVGEVHVVGNQKVKTSDLPELSTQPGQPYSEQDLANDRERFLSYYFDHGFPNASLEIATNHSPAQPNREDVSFSIHEGERFTVDQVMVGGLEHTRDFVVQRDLQVHAGDPLSQRDLLNTQTRLYDLGIFSQVDAAVQNPEGNDPLKNILIQVREAKRYTFTYGLGLEFQTSQPAGASAPQGKTGVSPRVEFDVTRLNFAGRDQTLTFQSHVGRLQQRGLISYTVPKLLNSDKFKLIYTIFYDNSLDVATFTSQRLEGKIDLRLQFGNTGTEPGTRPGPNSITYRFDFRAVKASHFATNFSPGVIALLSLPARVGGPGFTFIHDKRDNPLESTKGDYFTLDSSVAASVFGSRSETPVSTLPTNFGRALTQYSTYYAFGKGKPERRFIFARSTSIGLEQPFQGTRVLPPGSCPLNSAGEPTCDLATIPLPEQFFAGGGNSHRGFGLNQAGPRDPSSGFPVGGTALFVNNLELRFPPVSLPYLGEGFGFAIFHDMGNVFTAPHDMLKGLMRWHQGDPSQCLPTSTTNTQCIINFDNSRYDYTSQAVGVGVRYKTPLGPLRFDFGYSLNPTKYFQLDTTPTPHVVMQQLRHFNVFFSIGQPF
ncbi:MAG TPA: POTRA domain-containing protein [Candidatus Sulfotelmatobacter sp.]|nr:POTRA domain-containing protein [Candidatus Sulfotelmatobacter sp.]